MPHGVTPGPGDLLLACSDALIAAQNAVIAAESLGIGSCYIGDILELGEKHAELLHLPRYTFPVAMLCFGRPKVRPHRTERYEKHVVHKNAYRRLTAEELARGLRRARRAVRRRAARDGRRDYVQDVYARKFTADFAAEMNRSVAWWLERWSSGAGGRRRRVAAAPHQPHVPEATHHAGTANVTSAITATSAVAVPRRSSSF